MILSAFDVKFHETKNEIPPRACRPPNKFPKILAKCTRKCVLRPPAHLSGRSPRRQERERKEAEGEERGRGEGERGRSEGEEGGAGGYPLIYFHILHIPSYTFIYPKYPSYTFIYPHIGQNIKYIRTMRANMRHTNGHN